MKSFFTLFLALIGLMAYAQPANNDCAGAFAMPVQNGSCIVAAAGTTLQATASSQTAFIPSAADDDVWFKFTTPSGGSAGAVKVVVSVIDVDYGSSTPQSIHVELREGAGICDNFYLNSTTLSSSGGMWTLATLNPSTNYSVRVYSDDNTSHIQAFGMCVFTPTPAANDDCSTATPITISSNTGFVVQSVGTLGATASTQASGDASGKDDDVWFSFTTPASPMAAQAVISDYAFDAVSGQPVIELWDDCSATANLSYTFASFSKNFGTLNPSTTYKVRIYTYGSSSRFVSFKLTINLSNPPPANDTYFTASTITLSSASSCTSIVTGGTTANATTEFPPACSGASSPPKDVWYKFVPTQPTALIQLTNVVLSSGSDATMYMELFRGSNTYSVLCSNTNEMDLSGSDISHTLIPSTTYYLRIYNADAASACTFNICNKIPPPPVNDDCAGAINVPVNSATTELKVSASSVGATAGSPTLTCSGTADHDVWFKFIAPASGQVYINIFNSRATVLVSSGSPVWSVYSGTCGSLTHLVCNLNQTGSVSSLTAGATYYLRVYDIPGNQYAFDLSIKEVPATATNITCGTAIALDGNWKSGSTLGLSNTNLVPCSGGSPLSNKELWYSFTASATKHLIDFSDMVRLSANQNNLGYKVYSGTCAIPGTAILCVNNATLSNSLVTGLSIGNTYYVQLMENTYNGGPVMFKIKTIPQAAPANDESSGAITLIENPVCENTTGTFKFASMSANPTAGTFIGDVWYKFKAATTDATISVSGSPYIHVYNSDASTVFNDPGYGVNTLSLTGMTINNIYYIRLYDQSATPSVGPDADFTICVSGTPSVVAADAPTPGSTCITIDGTVTSTNSGKWLHLTHLGKMVASVFDAPGNAGMGNIIGKYYINSGTVRADAGGTEYLNRNFEITPAIQPTTPVSVRLYFTKAEFDAMVGANDGDGNDVYYLNDLKISKFSSNPCANALTLSGEVLYNISNWGTLSSSVYYIEVVVPSFSSFFLKNISGVLPVSCVGLSAERKSNRINLRWATASESNSDHFEIQRSADGRDFTKIASVAAAGNSSSLLNYDFNDETIISKITYYYRLLAVDKDGKQKFACNTVKAASEDVKQSIFGNIYPNPAKSEIAVQLQRSYSGNVGLQVINSTGQILKQSSTSIHTSDLNIIMNVSDLPNGVYVLRLQTVEGVETIRFTKQ